MVKVKTQKIIEVQDWDNLIQETYGKVYSFQQQDGCKGRQTVYVQVPTKHPEDYENNKLPEIINDEHNRGVSFESWLEKDPKAQLNPSDEELKSCNYYYDDSNKKSWITDIGHINMFWERNFYPHVDMIVNDLHKKGLLEAGDYGIDIDW